jgi:parvulin-like peptidyl-prolyl isomerase
MKFQTQILTVVLGSATLCSAQLLSSHAPAAKAAQGNTPQPVKTQAVVIAPARLTPPKPAVRVNGAVLTDIDITREMFAIFPYAQQHNGFPKDMEADIRKGAIDMVVFEELLYQDAKRRNVQVDATKLAAAVSAFRKGMDKESYTQYLDNECNGSAAVLREKIRRSLLIEKMLKTQVEQKSQLSLADAKAYYDKNSRQFEHGETVSIQSISIIPPANATAAMKAEAKSKITDIARLGKAAKTPRDFGLLAEQVSEDDWRTKLGDRGTVDVSNLPPEIVTAVRKMKAGEVSGPIQVDRAWVVIRLNAHTAAGKTPFAEATSKLQNELQKRKKLEVRAALNRQLRKTATVEVL